MSTVLIRLAGGEVVVAVDSGADDIVLKLYGSRSVPQRNCDCKVLDGARARAGGDV